MVVLEPHDLLRLKSIVALEDSQLPAWVNEIFPQSLTVVVRRSLLKDNQIPVGIRGPKREQRFASFIDKKSIKKVTTPYDLVSSRAWEKLSQERCSLPAMIALNEVAKILNNYTWGISGSVGFELATLAPTTKITSDLDLVWKPSQAITSTEAKKLLQSLNQFKVHVDLQVIQGTTGFSLEEYATSTTTLMLKTLENPILVQNPWLN